MDIDTILALFISTTAVFSVFLLLMVLRLGRQPYHYTYAIIQMVVILFMLGYVSDVYSPTIEGKLIWNNLEYFGNLFIPLLSLMFVMQFTGMDKNLVNKIVLALTLVSFGLLAAMATNSYHELVYTSVVLADDPLRSFDAEHGVLFYPIVILMIGEMVAACSIIWRSHITTAKVLQAQHKVLLISLLAPTILMSLLMPFWHDLPQTIIFIASILVSSLVIFLGIMYYDMFRAVPFTIDAVVRSSKDGMLVLDDQNRPMYMNTFASSLLGVNANDRMSVPVNELLPTIPSHLFGNGSESMNASMSDVELVPGRSFNLSVNKMKNTKGQVVGHVMIIHDITDIKNASNRMARTLKKMSIMNRISRYDLANEVMAMSECLTIMEKESSIPEVRFSKFKEILNAMDAQISFMKDYQELGERDPRWLDVDYSFSSVAASFGLLGVEVRSAVKVEILADPMLDKVFFNLLENSLSHGGHVTRIDLTQRYVGDDLLLVYTDDGNGIPAHEKLLLFHNSFGGSHMYGFFLIREILDMTGIRVSEEGKEGKGVTFKILVPKGRFRAVPTNDQSMPDMDRPALYVM
ncbi:MAG: ATP-binding protein [Methanomassiliicoccales archaeon]|nr:ATP-binding protein [Methanomassiliicoccales archaeon]